MDTLTQYIKLEQRFHEYGFVWPDLTMALDQIKSECDEVQAAANENNRASLQEELGDLLSAALSTCIHLGFDPQEVLKASNQKIENRFTAMQNIAADKGISSLKNEPIEVKLNLWKEAKKATNQVD
jgi:uncharacterized protein YabN with tetrapyrrole methylase and pyrophosphatase domain